MTNSKYFYLHSLGCAKNTVDSRSMAQLLDETGYQSTNQPGDAQLLIVNTCGFIGPARAESIQALQQLAECKTSEQKL
ncbi:MAG: 30S ribosomal protein S12 methylthiotransferase RimO, partial [Chloroflexota bacterium]|nr:30S ribosomal protein S12 methylthiotransferase RimO [Chloroflexota bacterium]